MPAKIVAEGNKVRYAVVAAGSISQEAWMPGVGQTTNSSITAIITSDPEKGRELSKLYGGLKYYSYEEFDQALKEDTFDALYIATPNWMHRQFAEPALLAGFHVLLEKPMEVTEDDCKAINAAAEKSGAKLMIAYRLHCEPSTVEIVNRVRRGDIGDPRMFNSTFVIPLDEKNHRAKNGYHAGPVPDMGTYPINACRTIFGMEPIEVFAVGTKTPTKDFNFHDTVSVTLKFPNERVAHFLVSYSATLVNRYTVVGTQGEFNVDPCFVYGPGVGISYTSTIDGKTETHKGPVVDHFGGQTDYFSKCIIEERPQSQTDTKVRNIGEDSIYNEPILKAGTGWRDVRVIVAVKRALETGQPQKLEEIESRRHMTEDQVRKFNLAKPPSKVINAAAPIKN
ncbi:glucose-fructose oxidoreductase [Planoprotostelium fungivorum]|uniref:D-xylose 1-dehydrogenase (NADP(+), D-xylono-1,5-lactone-forming) n=1 Tax=Planoprotostelium fungivorum TaxID=1890364 RepID=A0A2P6N9Y3_9EUKA|nr:glucose-fructose oxidoreductase [Planoprotostelium fungivorum]